MKYSNSSITLANASEEVSLQNGTDISMFEKCKHLKLEFCNLHLHDLSSF